MSDDLVKRLRYALHDMQGRVEASKLGMFEKAIDRIAALQARVAELNALHGEDMHLCAQMQLEAELATERAERAEAALATARDDALEAAANRARARGEQYREPTESHYDMRNGCYDAAAAILALKGGAA